MNTRVEGRPLNERQLETLARLYAANVASRFPREWVTPQDLGGVNRSHHSATLATLAMRGLVQFKQRGAKAPPGGNGRRHGSLCYRITPAGIAAL